MKYHLCISFDGHFVFLNSPKAKIYPTDLVVPCAEFPFLKPTESGESVISCSYVMQKTDEYLVACGAKKLGSVSVALLRQLGDFIQNNPALSDEEREEILQVIGDWVGAH